MTVKVTVVLEFETLEQAEEWAEAEAASYRDLADEWGVTNFDFAIDHNEEG